MWRVKYDEFVRRNCKERQLVYPQVGSAMRQKLFGKNAPPNAGVMQHVMDRAHGSGIMKAHQDYLSDNVFVFGKEHIKQMTGFGEREDDDRWSDFEPDWDDDAEEAYHYMYQLFESGRQTPPHAQSFSFLPDSDDEKDAETPFHTPIAHRTRSRAPRYGEADFPTDLFGSPFGQY